MMKALRPGAAGLATTALLLAGGIAPAWCDTYRHRDASHDVAGTIKGGIEYQRASVNRKFDITRALVQHDTAQIHVSATLRSASMKGVQTRTLAFKMKTNTDIYFANWVQHHGEYQIDLWNDTAGQAVTCNSLQPNTRHRTISMTLDRSCVDNPRWIRVVTSVSGHRVGHTFDGRDFYDIAQPGSWKVSDYKTLSPRLRPSA